MTHDDIDDESERWRDEKLSPEEREQEQRAAQARHDEVMAYAREMAAAREARLWRECEAASHPSINRKTPQQANEDIRRVVRQEMNKPHIPLLRAVAEAVVAEEKQREKTDAAIMVRLDMLTREIDEMCEKIVRLETTPANRSLKVVRQSDDGFDAASMIG